ncbi:hypothetical protein DFP72DRAFT_871939 [Ephemerocybe angulata]|uniref:F-box domain-containing protein n=1 Tax=Ephemerocybe angulata TaxID=980116 RepID=A0A8H6MCR4_9AGAR|nr:hypothetical protein DFP72DRAFT_871939 [Tulosesus angulatus]
MDPPFAQFFNTNHIPTEEELDQINELLRQDKSRLANIEIELQALAKEKSTILNRTKPLRALTSLIRRLPTPIMEAIFLFSFPSKPNFPNSIGDPPLIFLRVCRPWRNMALEMPRLWTTFMATVPFQLFHNSESARIPAFEAELSRWLERSGDLPLTVEAHMPYTIGPSPVMKTLSRVAQLAAKHSNRWESLDLGLCPTTSKVFGNLTELTALKSLVITSDKPLWPASTTWAMPGNFGTISDCYNLLKAPNLTRLQILDKGSSLLRLSEFPGNLGKLTSLILRYRVSDLGPNLRTAEPMFLRMLQLLRQCSSLQQCAITLLPCTELASAFSTAISPVVIPNLNSFYLEGCSKQIEMLMQSIDTPSLRELHYRPHHSLSPHTSPPIVEFLRTYGRQIEVLHLSLPIISTPGFYACIRSCPSLKQFALGPKLESLRTERGPPQYGISNDPPFVFMDEHLEALTPGDPGDPAKCPCPCIEILRIHVKSRVSSPSVLAFLKAKVKVASLNPKKRNETLKELAIRQLPLDFPYLNIRLKGGKEEVMPVVDDLKEFVEARVKLIFEGPFVRFPPTPFYGPTTPNVGYETDFASPEI